MTLFRPVAAALFFLAMAPMSLAQTAVAFWHSQDATAELIETFAEEFNARQELYHVEPRLVGSYQEGAIKLIAALSSGRPPALFDAELTVFMRLVDDRALHDLSDLVAELPAEVIADFYPNLWGYGEVDGARYGLPWSNSVPVLVYNATVLAQLGVEVPQTWEEFEAAAARLTTRNTRGYIDVAAAFIFETMVTTRGGSVVTADGEPNFDSPEALAALEQLARMARARHSIPRSFAELDQALVDFARTKGMMAIASQALFPQGERFSVGFEVGAAPVPHDCCPAVPLTGSQLVVPRAASAAERAGAFAFWRYLTEPEQVVRWVQASYFLPVRRSATELLEPWYAASADRRAGLVQLEDAVWRPRVGAYALWQGFLEEAIERVTKGGADPAAALQEAQRRALQTR